MTPSLNPSLKMLSDPPFQERGDPTRLTPAIAVSFKSLIMRTTLSSPLLVPDVALTLVFLHQQLYLRKFFWPFLPETFHQARHHTLPNQHLRHCLHTLQSFLANLCTN